MAEQPKVVVNEGGPYRVLGGIPLRIETIVSDNAHSSGIEWKIGESFEVSAHYLLCACGKSANKPFCDGSHLEGGPASPTAPPSAEEVAQPVVYEGPTLRLVDDVHLCAFARFCDAENIWKAVPRSGDPQVAEIVKREALACPSGRLVLFDKVDGKEIDDAPPVSIGLVQDPAIHCSGPLAVRGRVPIERADGSRYATGARVTLCRCGTTRNPPFCDGHHSEVGFKDGLAAPLTD